MLSFLQQNYNITSLSGFKTKATTKYYFEINSVKDILNVKAVGRFCEENNLGMLFVGKGTNMLFAFDEYNGVIIKNNLKGWEYHREPKVLKAYSGELISLIASSLKEDYENNIWERFIGLPGTIGAAVIGNAGAFGLDAECNFFETEVYNLKTGQVEIFNKEKMQFGYRDSFIKRNSRDYFLINIKFDLSKKLEKYHSRVNFVNFRENQPKGLTCGSFFKNPDKENPAGKLIEEVGLKGYKIGGAFFSPIHANFLMSDGTATYKDLLDLVELVIEKVKEEKRIILEPEVRIVING